VPNLLPDRGVWVAAGNAAVDVRRLMYQSLIWISVMRDDSSGVLAPAYAKDVQRLADALIDGVRRDLELGGDFLGRQMLIDEPEAVELPRAQARDKLSHRILPSAVMRFVRGGNHASFILQRKNNPPHHRGTPEQRVHEPL
jgi:hypothetical protein